MFCSIRSGASVCQPRAVSVVAARSADRTGPGRVGRRSSVGSSFSEAAREQGGVGGGDGCAGADEARRRPRSRAPGTGPGPGRRTPFAQRGHARRRSPDRAAAAPAGRAPGRRSAARWRAPRAEPVDRRGAACAPPTSPSTRGPPASPRTGSSPPLPARRAASARTRSPAWVYWAIMCPESTPASSARNGGRPRERAASSIRSVRRSHMLATSATGIARKSST